HGAYLHVPERKLFAGDPPREVVHQLLFTHGKAFDDSPLLPLERFAFEYLRNSPPQEVHARLHVFLKYVSRAPRQRKQPWPVGYLEVVDVTLVQRRFGGRVQVLDHLGDRAAAAGARQSAHEHVVARRGQLHAHLQRPQRALLSNKSFALLRLRRGFKGHARQLATPPQLVGRQFCRHGYLLFGRHTHSRAYSSTERTTTPEIYPGRYALSYAASFSICSRCSMYTRNTPIAAARMVGPATKPSSPKASKPPRMLMNSSRSFNRVRFLISSGLTKLSATPATPLQIATNSTALPQCPLIPSHSAAGTQISAEPTTGTIEKNAISTPMNTGVPRPVSANAVPPRTPWITAINSATATLA